MGSCVFYPPQRTAALAMTRCRPGLSWGWQWTTKPSLHLQNGFWEFAFVCETFSKPCSCWGSSQVRSLSPCAGAWSSLQQVYNTSPQIGQQSITKAYPQYISFNAKWQAAQHWLTFFQKYLFLRRGTELLSADCLWSRSYFIWVILLWVVEQ